MDTTPSCGLPEDHAPHVIRAAVGESRCEGKADRPAPSAPADDDACTPPCSDPLCPCTYKWGHTVWPSERVTR